MGAGTERYRGKGNRRGESGWGEREREEVTPAWWVASGMKSHCPRGGGEQREAGGGWPRPPRNPCKPVQPSLGAERAAAGAAGEGSVGEGSAGEGAAL